MKETGSTMKAGIRVALVAALLAGGLAACSSGGPEAEVVAARKANFKAIGKSFKTVGDELKTGKPDLDKVRKATQELVAHTEEIKDHFPAGSGPESGAKTKAKAAVWANPAEFNKDREAAVAAARELDKAAGTGDLAALAKASETLGKTCQDCHTQFREK